MQPTIVTTRAGPHHKQNHLQIFPFTVLVSFSRSI